ncbi:MAG: hypothetical protein RBR35_07625 [Salinivirgaceae bacterium]|nr:hypothetical protein [Salinivirgaceae bacterium]
MNIELLKSLLNRDIVDLKEIASNIEPGYVLSKMEVQIIQSRINNLSNSIDELFLAFEMGKGSEKESVVVPEITVEKVKSVVKPEHEESEIIVPASNPKPQQKQHEKTEAPSIVEKPTVQEIVHKKETPKLDKPKNVVDKEIAIESTDPEAHINEPTRSISAESTKKKTLADNFSDSAVSLNELVGQAGINSDRASMLSRKPILDIHKAINLNERIAFIRDLFSGDAKRYTSTIDQLNAFDDFSQAIDYINQEFNWDQSTDNFKIFIEIIYRRYIN